MVKLKRKGNTKIVRENGEIRVIYHYTPVVVIREDGVTLNTGGFRTLSTKSRMNQVAAEFNLGFHISQKNGSWDVQTPKGVYPFNQGTITLEKGIQI
jgi:hypothetical protein